jgi:ligand-binding sensor domain-containing protein
VGDSAVGQRKIKIESYELGKMLNKKSNINFKMTIIMKRLIYILCFAVAFFFHSCDKSELEPKEFELGSLQKILDGFVVKAIAFDSKGNAWIGTQGNYLIRYNVNETVIYNSENSALPEDFVIWDIAVDKNDNVWIGADGVWKYDGNEFTHYNSQNTTMPEDVVWSIAVDSKNNIWFASCRFRQGGLVKYDGTNWTTYTPDNSSLPTNSIKSIAIDKSDNVWLSLSDYVNQAYLAKISNGEWYVYDENDFGFTPYYFGGIQIDSKNRLWGTIDYSLSSTFVSPSPHFFIFDGKNTAQLSCGENMRIGGSRTGITIDKNDNIWCFGVGSVCGVWVGEQWIQLDKSDFGGSSVWVIKEDLNRRIWFGTENGIYIRGL